VVDQSEFFAQRIHRVHLRFVHRLDVDILCRADIAVPEDSLDRLIGHTQLIKIRRKAAPESVPAVPAWQ